MATKTPAVRIDRGTIREKEIALKPNRFYGFETKIGLRFKDDPFVQKIILPSIPIWDESEDLEFSSTNLRNDQDVEGLDTSPFYIQTLEKELSLKEKKLLSEFEALFECESEAEFEYDSEAEFEYDSEAEFEYDSEAEFKDSNRKVTLLDDTDQIPKSGQVSGMEQQMVVGGAEGMEMDQHV